MKTRLKEKLVIGMLAFAVLGMASCGKDEDKATTSPDTNSMELLSYMPPKKIKQVITEHDGDGYTTTFFWDGDLLVGQETSYVGEGGVRNREKYVYSNGRLDTVYEKWMDSHMGGYEKMIYEGDRLVKIKRVSDVLMVEVDGRIFVEEVEFSQTSETELVYKDGYVSEVRDGNYVEEYEWEYGNVVKYTQRFLDEPDNSCVNIMKYDSNPSPFPVIGMPFNRVGQSWCKNNPIKSICTCENVDYDITYTYDSDGMPVSSVWVDANGREERMTYTYYE